jgi:hypothetical protein
MPDAALVAFSGEENTVGRNPFLLSGCLKRRAGMALYRFFNKKAFESGIQEFSIASTELLRIGLPFARSSIGSLNSKYLADYIFRICSEYGCARCFFPGAQYGALACMEGAAGTVGYYRAEDIRPSLCKSLFIPILHELYGRAGIRLDSLDIAFVCGSDPDELFSLVKRLEPYVKYVNIAAPDKGSLEAGLASLCDESGLSAFVSSDFDRILRNADLVIHLGDAELLSKYHIGRHTLVLNYSEDNRPVLRGEFPVINGLLFSFPGEVLSLFGEGIRRNYSREELSEILLGLKAGLPARDGYGSGDDAGTAKTAEVAKIAEAELAEAIFNASRCRITGFAGRRSVLQPDFVRKAAGLPFHGREDGNWHTGL